MGWGLDGIEQFNIAQPEYMKSLADLYTEENLGFFKDWLIVRSTGGWRNYLDKDTRDASTAAENEARGIQGLLSDDVAALNCLMRIMPIPLDNMYVRTYCTPEQREDITEITQELIDGYREMLQEEEWLSQETRDKAIEKLDAMTVRMVYPDELEAWDDLEFDDFTEGGNLLDASLAISAYFRDRTIALVGEKVDKAAWNRYGMQVSTPNAFYDEGDNSINILAGALHGVVYQDDFAYEQKLGGIGVVIGHDISHAFDPFGAQFDKDGRFSSWWTPEDKKAFDERASKIIAFYDALEPIDGIKYSGQLVQTEAIADLGGMKCALRVAADREAFDYEKFFESYAKLWAGKRFKSDEIKRLKTDVHPLGYLRANVSVMQFDEFQACYDVKPGDGMYLAPEDRITVW